jgi:hypothetical protein
MDNSQHDEATALFDFVLAEITQIFYSQKWKALVVVPKVTGSISFLASGFVARDIIKTDKTSLPNRIVFLLTSVADMMRSFFMDFVGRYLDDTNWCQLRLCRKHPILHNSGLPRQLFRYQQCLPLQHVFSPLLRDDHLLCWISWTKIGNDNVYVSIDPRIDVVVLVINRSKKMKTAGGASTAGRSRPCWR